MADLYLPAKEFVAPDGTVWWRVGDCDQCGLCCTGDPTNGTVPGVVEGMCPYFRWVDGKGVCSVRDEPGSLWEKGCASWPNEPAHLDGHPYCKFQFVKSW